MDVQQHINFEILEKFNEEGIEMAYPTQTLYVNQEKKE
jgi:small-conductance mechanosensitive channel